jgi:integrase/recombinase XerC/integrase/recombinase XerD
MRSGVKVHYADCYYWINGARKRCQRSTGIVDDGTAKSKRTAEIVARDIESSLAAGTGRRAKPTTLGKAIDMLIEKRERSGRSDKTCAAIVSYATPMFRFFGSSTLLQDISAERVASFVAYREAQKRVAGTIRNNLLTLGAAFGVAGVEQPAFPEVSKKPVVRERWLNEDEQRRLLAVVSPERRLHVLAYLRTGCRKSDLWKIESIDWDAREMRVRGTKTKGSDRTVPIDGELYEAMFERRHEREMFTKWGHKDAAKAINRYGVRAGLGKISFNTLRHSFATQMAIAGVPILFTAKLMGTSVRMLEHVYTHVSAGKHMHEALAKLPPLTRATTVTQNQREQRTLRTTSDHENPQELPN